MAQKQQFYVDGIAYPLQAVRLACESLSREYETLLTSDGQTIIVHWQARADDNLAEPPFASALLDAALRIQIEERTRDVRRRIIETALAEAMPRGARWPE